MNNITGKSNFNLAFGLLASDGSEIDNIDQYFHLVARKYAYVTQPCEDPKFEVDAGFHSLDGNTFYKNIPIHKCNVTDLNKIYPPNINFAGTFNYYMSVLYCFDNLNDITIFGDITTDYS